MPWEWIVLGYVTYLALVAVCLRRFHRARGPTLALAFAAWTVWAMTRHVLWSTSIEIVVPAACLLVGYWMSGLFFVTPMTAAERWLLRVDERVGLAHVRCPRLLRDYFELAYVLVYAVVPAGAITLALGGHVDAVPRFWSVVLLAEFVSYAMLPWVQTRPPRAIDAKAATTTSSPLRRFNLAVLGRASIQANTLPSGHAAGAMATALAIASVMPAEGVVFLVLAISIAIATVIGRYHYTVDSVLGIAVAIGAWVLLGGH